MISKNKLLDKCEAMTLLCTNASTHWSFIKFCFNIPLVLTSSTMCIINSISEDANAVKIPNIVVNAVSVLIIDCGSLALNKEFSVELMLLFDKSVGILMIINQNIIVISVCHFLHQELGLVLLSQQVQLFYFISHFFGILALVQTAYQCWLFLNFWVY